MRIFGGGDEDVGPARAESVRRSRPVWPCHPVRNRNRRREEGVATRFRRSAPNACSRRPPDLRLDATANALSGEHIDHAGAIAHPWAVRREPKHQANRDTTGRRSGVFALPGRCQIRVESAPAPMPSPSHLLWRGRIRQRQREPLLNCG